MNCIGKFPAISSKTALRVFLCKDAFDLWWQWAERPHESLLMIDADIHNPIMELSPEDRRDRAKINEAVRRYREVVLRLTEAANRGGLDASSPYVALSRRSAASSAHP